MISVVIPAFNEQDAIASSINEIKNVLNKADIEGYEIIVVSDGSTDQTAQRAEEAGAMIILNPHNMGYGFSLKAGIAAAKHETIVINDADLTYPFDVVPKLLAEKRKGFDLVVGARTGEHYLESFIKSPLRWILKGIVEFVAGNKIKDINSGLRVFDRSTTIQYFNKLCNTFSFTTSQTLAYMMTGKFVTYVDIPYNKRVGKTKVKLIKDSLRTLQYIIEACVYYNPLRIFFLFSMLCVIFSVVGLVITAASGIKAGYFLGIGGLLIALFVFCIGLLSVLLKQIMDKSDLIIKNSKERENDQNFRF